MSHTNSTPNYNLPQFAGTDKPTWLNDVNGAMSAIDTQMKANADSATQANTNATTAVNNTGTLTNLNTTDKTSLVGAVNEINTNLGVVSGVASSASATATNANNKIDSLESKLNFTQFRTYTSSDFSGTGYTFTNIDSFSVASNADGSVGKIYGTVNIECNNANGFEISFPTPLRPSTNIAINGVLWVNRETKDTGNKTAMITSTINIATDGTVTIRKSGAYYNCYVNLNFVACLLFLQDFGDTPENA
jgi:hypothetical protein